MLFLPQLLAELPEIQFSPSNHQKMSPNNHHHKNQAGVLRITALATVILTLSPILALSTLEISQTSIAQLHRKGKTKEREYRSGVEMGLDEKLAKKEGSLQDQEKWVGIA